MNNNFNEFNALSTSLSGSNLIEASAGTGKTYSIAVLFLRMLLEKKINVKNILMVTFTKAAVQELSERIKLFLRTALQIVSQKDFDYPGIIGDIIRNTRKKDTDHNISKLLLQANRELDELSIFTIHGFCYRIISDFSFETGSIMDMEFLEDIDDVIENLTAKFWRKHIEILDENILEIYLDQGLSFQNLLLFIKKGIYGGDLKITQKEFTYKEFFDKKEAIKQLNSPFSDKEKLELLNIIKKYKTASILQIEKCLSNRKDLLNLVLTKEKTLKKSFQKQDILNSSIFHKILESQEKETELRAYAQELLVVLYKEALFFCRNEFSNYKKQNYLRDQNDIISELYENIIKGNNLNYLTNILVTRYSEIFIDEFQDTDYKQYYIFKKLFMHSSDTTTFFIGDPKQSIYSWRGADLYSYQMAKKEIQNLYTMSINYRSNSDLIRSFNSFFDIENCFYNNLIAYIPVFSPIENSEKEVFLYKNNQKDEPLSIIYSDNVHDKISALKNIVIKLLSEEYKLGDSYISPCSIGILVRKNSEAILVQNYLLSYGINSTVYASQNVLELPIAQDILIFLKAIFYHDRSSVNHIFTTVFFDISLEDILLLDDSFIAEFLHLLKNLSDSYTKNGIFNSINKLIDYLGVKKNMSGNTRILADIQQILEILHSQESKTEINLYNLIFWMESALEGEITFQPDFERRLDDDKIGINIVTIHKSKGLSYDIVLAPFLELETGVYRSIVSYRYQEKHILSLYKDEEDIGLLSRQLEEENRRLIYVALTRSRYKVFLFVTQNKESSLSIFLKQEKGFQTLISSDLENNIPPIKTIDSQIKSQFGLKFQRKLKFYNNFESFSSLSKHSYNTQEYHKKDLIGYEQFIMHDLGKGALVGNFIHYILENSDFSNPNNWERAILKGKREYSQVYKENFKDYYLEMIRHISHLDLGGFSLHDVCKNKKLIEWEFYFKAKFEDVIHIQKILSDYGYQVNLNKTALKGVLHGFIDLLFVYESKYYILDWKSNYLGDDVDNYSMNNIRESMISNNYYLQYIIYIIALKRFMKHHQVNFENSFGGVFYIFIRGVRQDLKTGIYFDKPPLELLEGLDEFLLEKYV